VRLGFLIDSERAHAFRDEAEDFILTPATQLILTALPPCGKVQRRPTVKAGITIFTSVAEVLVIAIALLYAVLFAPFWLNGDSSN
jgi:hypothetical protein